MSFCSVAARVARPKCADREEERVRGVVEKEFDFIVGEVGNLRVFLSDVFDSD